eukprot:11227384-Lingulodinium_polyedra.AAC.1
MVAYRRLWRCAPQLSTARVACAGTALPRLASVALWPASGLVAPRLPPWRRNVVVGSSVVGLSRWPCLS